MNLQESISQFLLEQKLRGNRERTLQHYNYSLNYLLKENLTQETNSLNTLLVNTILNKPVKAASLRTYDTALRVFCNWLETVELLDKNPFKNRKRPKARFEFKEVLTVPELQKIFQAAEKSQNKYRNLCLLAVFLETGLRASEVIRLKVSDLDFDTGTLKVDGKTGNSSVPIGTRTLRLIRLYLSRERKGSNLPNVFLSSGKVLRVDSLNHLIGKLATQAGIERNVGPHLLRHTFATLSLKAGMDTLTLQRMLRHTSPAMTSRYVHFLTEDLQAKSQQFTPLKNIQF